MTSRFCWTFALAATAVSLASAPQATAQECPATCRVTKAWFAQVVKQDAVTVFVDGYGPSLPPSSSQASGFNLYSLTLTAAHAADAARALESGCPVEVRFWTRGQMLLSHDVEAGFSGHLETQLVSPTGTTLLDAQDRVVTGPPTPQGNYPLEHVVPLGTAPLEGDALNVTAAGSAFARALGLETRDYASAYFKMYPQMTSGAPILQMCVPD